MSTDTIVYSYIRNVVPPGKYRSCPKGGEGVICMRIIRPSKVSNGPDFKYDVTFAFCNPTDNFNKETGRRTMINRHYNGEFTVKFKSNIKLSTKQTVARALKSMKNLPKVPQWTKDGDVLYGKKSKASYTTMERFITDNTL